MEIGLDVRIVYQDNDVIELRVYGSNGKYCGTTEAYVGIGELEEAALKIKGFPTGPADTREIVFGSFGSSSAGGGVRLRFYCIDASVHARARVEIEVHSDQTGDVETVSFLLPIEAAGVDSFVAELGRINIGQQAAYLKGSLRE